MEKEYFVTYGFFINNQYMLSSRKINTRELIVKDMSQGQLAEYLEKEVSDITDDPTVVILNYWEM